MFTKNSRKGFTIVELVIVIAIIAILATALIPTFGGLIGSANRTVDEQLVRQINTYLMLEEAINGKPATVADVQKILTDNGLTPVKANLANNTIYWVGSHNRAIIWTAEGETGKVTYPEEYAELYASLEAPSADWAKLGDSAGTIAPDVVVVAPVEGETLETALRAALTGIPADAEDVVIQLPQNTDADIYVPAIGQLMKENVDVTIDLNGGTLGNRIHSEAYPNRYGVTIPTGRTLTLTNGSLDCSHDWGESSSNIAVQSGSSLILRDMEIVCNGAALYPEGTASEIVIENCTIKTTGGYGVGTNRAQSSNIRIVIRNSTIEASGGVAVFINTSGDVVIESSTIIGGRWGLVVRAGSAMVSDTTIKVANTEPGTYSYNNFNPFDNGSTDWKDGVAMPEAGIIIGCYANNDSYSGDATVELTNVKIETPDASVLPTVLMAARQDGKIASLTYDEASSVGDVKIFGQDWAGAETTFEHKGTITVNGVEQTLGG